MARIEDIFEQSQRIVRLISIGIVVGGSIGWTVCDKLQVKLERGDRTPARNRKNLCCKKPDFLEKSGFF